MKKLFLCTALLVFLIPALARGLPPSAPTKAKHSKTDTTNFDGNLSSSDVDVQTALETLDEVVGVGDTTETNQDDAWAAVGGAGTETGIDVTYQDATDDVDFVIDVTELSDLTWSDGTNATNTWTFDVSGTDHTMAAGSGLMTFSHDIKISGDDLYMNTNTDKYILVADGTNFNPVESTGDVIIANTGAATIQANAVEESMLKAVDGASDEDILTKEDTTGDFEWHSIAEVFAASAEGALPNDSILEADLKAVDAAADEDFLSYESTTGDFEWHSVAELFAKASEGALPDDNIVEADLKAVDAAADEDVFTYESTTGDFEWHSVDEIAGSISAGALTNASVVEDDLASALAFDEGDLIDLSGITMSAGVDEGIALPTYADVVPTTEKYYAAYDAANNRIMVRESGGWVDTSAGSGAATSLNFVVTSAEGSLSDESVLTEGYAIDVTDAGGDGGAVTVALDTTEVSADGSDTWSDGSNASIVWTFDVSGTDHTMTFGNGLVTFGDAVTVTDTLTTSAGINLGTSQAIVGTTAITIGNNGQTIAVNSSDWDIDATGIMTNMGNITSDGVVTATGFTIGSAAITETELEILDGASLSTSDINIIDGVSDSGTLTAAELLYVDGVTSAIQTQLDARCLESVFGTALEADDLTLNGTTLELVAEIPHLDATENISAVWEVQDDVNFQFGNDGDFWIEFATADSELDIESNNAAADTVVRFENNDATYEMNVEIEGDLTVGGTLTVSGGAGPYYAQLTNNAGGYDGSNYQIYVDAGTWKVTEAGVEETIALLGNNIVWTGTHDFSSSGSLELPNGAAPTVDAFGEIAGDNNAWDTGRGTIILYDGTATAFVVATLTSDTPSDGQVAKWNTGGTITWENDEDSGGSPSWDSITDSEGAMSIEMGAAAEDTTFTMSDGGAIWTWQFTGAPASGPLFEIEQVTGNPTGGVLFAVKAADSDITAAQIGDGTNDVTISQSGVMTFAGSADIDLPNDSVDAADINTINCGTNCTWDAANDEIDVDDAFITNNAADAMAAAAPGLTFQDSDDAAGTAYIYANSSGGVNDIVFTIGVEDSGGEDQGYIELDGVNETVDVLQNSTVTGTFDVTGATSVTGNFLQKYDAAAYLTISTADGGATTLGATSDGTDQINIGDGSDDIASLYGGDENLTFADGGTNLITLGTDTGVTEVNSTLQFVTTGDIMGGVNVSSKAAAYTVGTDDAHESYGTLFVSTTAMTWTLPSAVAGMSMCFQSGQGRTDTVTVQATTGDYLVLDGARTSAAAEYLSSGAAAGDRLCIVAADATDWYVTGYQGTWTEE